jgi:UMF1 family MFS transporter
VRAEPVRTAPIITALWYFVFAVPLIFFGPCERISREPAARIVADGFRDLWRTLAALPRMPSVAWFLLAHMFFIDGVNTIFVFGPLIAKGVFGFSEIEMLLLGVTIYVAAGLGAIAFGWLDDWIGAKPVVAFSIVALIAISLSIFFIEARATFWLAACLLGVFFGPVQASSRSLMARLAPDSMRTKLFGLYALAGRAIGPLGAAMVGWVTLVSRSQRAGLFVIAALLLIGLSLLVPVRESRRTEATHAKKGAGASP